jgi:hypothetical protein
MRKPPEAPNFFLGTGLAHYLCSRNEEEFKMSTKKMMIGIVGLTMALSAASFADQQLPASGMGQGADKGKGNAHPCRKIMQACEAAGFVRGGHKLARGNQKEVDKGLMKDCMQPIMAGNPVAGVTVDPSDVQACQARKEHHKAKKNAKE